MGKTLAFCAFIFCFGINRMAFAQVTIDPSIAPSVSFEDEIPNDLSDHVQEVFLKGSSDGERIYTVLSISKAAKLSQKIFKKMVRFQELVDIGDRFNNPQHTNDFLDEWNRGIENTKKAAPQILKAPWRSVKKIAYSHRVTVQQARDAFASSGGGIEGSAKYTGLMAWAYLKDAYYLVIETPAQFVIQLAKSTSLPFRLTLQVAEIGIRFAIFAVKTVAAIIASGAIMAYSVVSTAIGGAINFLLEAPTYIWRPLQTGEDLLVKPDKLAELGLLLEDTLVKNVHKENEIVIEATRKEKREKYKVFIVRENKEKELAFVAKLKVKGKSIFFDFEMARGYFEELKQELEEQHVPKAYRKDKIKLDMRHIVDIFKARIKPEMMKLEELPGGNFFKRLQIEEELALTPDYLAHAGSILEQTLATRLGADRDVVVVSVPSLKDKRAKDGEPGDKKEHFKVYIGKVNPTYAYEATIKVCGKALCLDVEMVRGYFKQLKEKYRIQGVAKASLEEYASLELRRLVRLYKDALVQELAL